MKELEPKLDSQNLREHQIERIRSKVMEPKLWSQISRKGQHQQKSHHLGQGYFGLGRIGKFSIGAKLKELKPKLESQIERSTVFPHIVSALE